MAHAPSEVLRPSARPWPALGPGARGRSRLRRAALALAILLALVLVASLVVERPLRGVLERRLNAALDGYTATIGRVDLRILGFGFDLYDVTVLQDGLPDPPMVYLPRWTTSVHWRALLSGALVADMSFRRPQFYVTLAQARAEAADPTPAAEHGWQEAVTEIHPLKINRLELVDGSLYYWDRVTPTPVHLRRFTMRAENIVNARTVPGKYPSPVEIDAILADGARFRFDGRADFLAVPSATLKGAMRIRDLQLEGLAPALRAVDVEVEGGRLAAEGRIERTPEQTRLVLRRVTLDGARLDYVQRTADAEAKLDGVAKAATTSEAAPATRVDVREAVVRDGTFGLVNRQEDPPYRLFVDDTEARLSDFSNARAARRGEATLTGKFMGAAPLRVDADFAPGAGQPDFRMNLRLEEVPLPELNDLLRAKAGIDVVRGRLSLYSELTVAKGRVDGYVKPLFAGMDVYDAEQDEEKGPFRKLYEALVGGGAGVLENRPREEVATVADLSGPIENPDASTLDLLLGLLRNAFVKAILPGLEPGRR